MSTQQQALIIETVAAIKKALKRKPYESDSDSSVDHNTNRGSKLKKKARFVSHGRIGPSLDFAAYKEVAELAGHHRAILNENPPLIDDEGYDLDSDDDEERVQEALASAREDNPYSSIHLEQLLAPLTSVTELPTHPTLSRPFTSKALTELVSQARSLMQRENAALWKVKPLLTKLVGDNTWAPCGMMIEDNDHELFTDTARFLIRPNDPSASVPGPNGRSLGDPSLRETAAKSHTDGLQLPREEQLKPREEDGIDTGAAEQGGDIATGQEGQPFNADRVPPGVEGDITAGDAKEELNGSGDVEMGEAPSAKRLQDQKQPGNNNAIQHNGVTASAGQTNGGIPARLELLEELFIHPLFLPPRGAHPDRDIGLPEQEADDLRRILQVYVQKQEEVCRGTKRLYEGLLKADRLRKTVLQWAKAELHCGPNRDMSDGEDWYDKEEWGITEDLKKGEDEVEEDTAQTQKKTRNRK